MVRVACGASAASARRGRGGGHHWYTAMPSFYNGSNPMDIATSIMVTGALLAVGFTVGAGFADRRDRKQALTRLEKGEHRVHDRIEAAHKEIRELVAKINVAHNGLVENVATMAERVGSLESRTTALIAGKTQNHAQSFSQSPFNSHKTPPR